ncbi:unnamed protein product, partial [Mesorhabditis belari]|uniref:Uncharacterized protein n=1 Tax=Mesorhabditis belari TaxID=2138241 RepID=A0AAF3FGT7_9BILA
MADIVGPPSVQHSADSWSTTEVKSLQHNHVWTIRGFSQCECRYLETTVKVKEQIVPIPTQSVGLGDHGTLPFRIRLHPQGNKESNKDFTFFQVFCNAQQARYKAKFAVFNTRNEEIPTTVYTGTQQLHGYFEYIRRDLLVQHIAPQDELQLVLTLTITFDTVTKSSQNPLPRLSAQAEPKPAEVARDLENVFRDRRFCDFMIYVGDRRLDVHKVILAARSPYFAALLEPHTEESKKNCLRLNESDVEFEVMQELLTYMYTGRCTRLSDISLELLAAADRFAMPGLKDIAEQSLRAQLSIESVCRILCVADLHMAIALKKNAIQFITTQSQPVTETDGWKELVSNSPELVTEVVQAISAMNSNIAQTYVNANSSSSVISCEPPAAKRTRFGGMDASGHL